MSRQVANIPRQQPHVGRSQGWYPPALRWWTLLPTVLFCWSAVAVLQYFLHKSQTEGGIIFTPDVNKLPLHKSFAYLYLPTIVAVIFSIVTVWIDNDAKRYEPYRQMSKAGGASGKDSLLLHYPFDFIPFVPFIAAKRRHWLVFWAACATVATTFGVVPLQAGIFSSRAITRSFQEEFTISRSFIPAAEQQSKLTLGFAQSAYGILELNETLPWFMTRDYVLRPFTIEGGPEVGTWSTRTTMYNLDLDCHDGVVPRQLTPSTYTTNARIIGKAPSRNPSMRNRRYSGWYAGYFPAGISDWFREQQPAASRAGDVEGFTASFGENRASDKDPLTPWISISCVPVYYQQEVTATVDALTKSPIEVLPLGEREPLPADLFNNTYFQHVLAAGSRLLRSREYNLPVEDIPRYLDRLYRSELSPVMDVYDLPPMLAMAMTTSSFAMHELLDRDHLIEAYRQAYGLLFARVMVDVLKPDYTAETSKSTGLRLQRTQAVILEPVFTYIVEGLLLLISLMILAVFSLGITDRRKGYLLDDPGSIAAVMSMTAESSRLLHQFEDLDCSTVEHMQHVLSRHQTEIQNADGASCVLMSSENEGLADPAQTHSGTSQHLPKPMRPKELRVWTAVPFISLFTVLLVFAAVVFAKASTSGLPLPSENPIVLNLLTEYLPTALATLIEPMWILINRLLCLLQPLEELRSGKATATKSIALNYNSLPPQLTIFKAARAGHIVLVLVCAMSLLSNLLATAFAGLFFTASVPISKEALFDPPFQARFTYINGSSGPSFNTRPLDSPFVASGAYQGGIGEDHFLISESNYTRNTSLPSWTDEHAMYLPFRASDATDQDNSRTYTARTKYFSGTPNCKPLTWNVDYRYRTWIQDRKGGYYGEYNEDPMRGKPPFNKTNLPPDTVFWVELTDDDGHRARCYSAPLWVPSVGNDLGYTSQLSRDGLGACREGALEADISTPLAARPNATARDQEMCKAAGALGWWRRTQEACIYDRSLDGFDRNSFDDPSATNTFFMTCQPRITIGEATVIVDSAGVLQEPATDHTPLPDQSSEATEAFFTNGAQSLIQQSNLFLFRSLNSAWNNDSYGGEYMHYFMTRAAGTTHLTDPTQPLPNMTEIEPALNKAYARLFAIWLSVNQDVLFEPASNASTTLPSITGTITTLEPRLHFVTPLFIISTAILAIYILVALLVFVRRPARYLPRLPTSIGAVIALFASSAAVRDLRGTAHMTNARRAAYLAELDARYGYGSFVGVDGAVHVGIEKAPFVRVRQEGGFSGTRAHLEARRRGEGEGRKKGEKKGATVVSGGYVNVPLEDGGIGG